MGYSISNWHYKWGQVTPTMESLGLGDPSAYSIMRTLSAMGPIGAPFLFSSAP